MAVARASASARCRGWSAAPKKPASVLSLQLGTSSAASASRARVTVSSTGGDGQRSPLPAQAAARKLTSKGALCAVRTQPWTKSRSTGSTAAAGGASATMASLMPVSSAMSAGMAWPGFTRVANSASIRPPRTRTAPISVIPAVSGDQPVVSMSTTAKSRLCSVRHRSASPGRASPGPRHSPGRASPEPPGIAGSERDTPRRAPPAGRCPQAGQQRRQPGADSHADHGRPGYRHSARAARRGQPRSARKHSVTYGSASSSAPDRASCAAPSSRTAASTACRCAAGIVIT